MTKTAKVYAFILNFCLISLLSAWGQPVKSEQPIDGDYLITTSGPLEFNSKQS